MVPDWDVVENDDLDDGLLEQSSRLIQSWFPDAVTPIVSAADLRWKLDDRNPAGTGFMTLAVGGGEVVGTMTIVRKRFVLGGEPVPVAEVGDTFTDRRYLKGGRPSVPWQGDDRHYLSRSLFGRLTTETMARADRAGVSLYFGVANETALPGYVKRLGFTRWPGAQLRTWTRPGAALLAERTRLPLVAALVVERAHAAAASAALSTARGYRTTELRSGSDLGPIDELWDRARSQWPFQPVRDAEWFRYRFFEHPTARYRVWLVHRRAALVGAYVTRSYLNGSGAKVIHVADQLFDREAAGLVPTALAVAARREGGTRTHSTSTWTQEPWPEWARRLGAVVHTHDPGLIVRHNPAAPLDLDGIDAMPFATATSDNV